MKMNRILLFLGLIIFIFSCDKIEDEPSGNLAQIEIRDIQFTAGLEPENKRINQGNIWKHPVGNVLNLTFDPFSGGSTFNLNINPSDFSTPYQIQIPFGHYAINGNTSTPSFSDILPISISDELEVNNSTINYSPISKSSFGLLTISKKGLQEKPEIISPENLSLAEKGDFYYLYGEMGMEITLSLLPNNTNKNFRSIWKSESYLHDHLVVQRNNSEEIDSFIPVDFKINQEIIPLGDDFSPTGLSPTLISILPESQNETSGLASKGGRLFSINDSGDDAIIYELDHKNGNLLRAITIENASNKDWESLAQSESHLFIGDIGNNNGNRNDLVIYKVAWSEILSSSQVSAEKIYYKYEDQTDFSGQDNGHNFDAEALVFANGALHLFSKNRGDGRTKHYLIPAQSGNHSVAPLENFDAKGLITGADFDPASNNLVLLGYTIQGINSKSFLWLISDIQSNLFFLNEKKRLDLGSPAFLGQTEGISFSSGSMINLSSEGFNQGGFSVDQRLMKMDLLGLF